MHIPASLCYEGCMYMCSPSHFAVAFVISYPTLLALHVYHYHCMSSSSYHSIVVPPRLMNCTLSA